MPRSRAPLALLLVVVCVVFARPSSGAQSTGAAPDARAYAKAIFQLEPDTEPPTLAADKVLRMPGTSRERALLPEGTTLSEPSIRTVRAATATYRLVLWEAMRPDGDADGGFGEQAAVLAVFPEGAREPTDVAELKTDRSTFFGEEPLLALGPDEAFTIVNHHANAGQPYTDVSLFHLVNGRLRRIANMLLLSSMGGCASAFRETLHWRTERVDGPYPKVIATVDVLHAPDEDQEGCDPPRARQRLERFSDTYTWDAAKKAYSRSSGTLDRLDRWNRSQM